MKNKNKSYIFFALLTLFSLNIISGSAPETLNEGLKTDIKNPPAIFKNNDKHIEDILIDQYNLITNPEQFKKTFSTDNIKKVTMLLLRGFLVIILYFLFLKIGLRFINTLVESIVRRRLKAMQGENFDDLPKADDITITVTPVLKSIYRWVIAIIAGLILLAELGIDVMPIVYSFSVLGLAISFGSQTLVKNLISGIMNLLDGLVSVGEMVEINGNMGIIKGINLKAIEFQHVNGNLQNFTHGDITSLVNLSRNYKSCHITLPVAHSANLDIVHELFQKVYDSMKNDPTYKKSIKTEMIIYGLADITEVAMVYGGAFRTTPDPYNSHAKEYRNRLMKLVQEYKIPMPEVNQAVSA